jgi:uncharacterized membrane protein YfcA
MPLTALAANHLPPAGAGGAAGQAIAAHGNHVAQNIMNAAILDGTTAQIVGSFVLYFSSTLSAAAGVGGGALNVPIFYLIWGFTYRESVVMSLATLMGNYLCQVIINLPERHPIVRERPLIYWDAILILLPAELAGANIGVVLSYIFPDPLCIILGMIVLVIAGTAATHKGLQVYSKYNLWRVSLVRADWSISKFVY